MSHQDTKSMTSSQRVLAMEELWESLCSEADDPESPDWHRDLLEERRATIESGDSRFSTLAELKDRLRG